jgi:hypothetical protein
MFHRFSTWWRALCVVLLSLAAVTWPSAAHAETTAVFSLEHQGAVVLLSTQGSGRFDTSLHFDVRSTPITVQVSLYPHLIARSQLAPIISGSGETASSIATTGNFSLTCVNHQRATFSVAVITTFADGKGPSCESRRAQLHLTCAGSACDGVYPISYSVSTNDTTQTTWSLLSIQSGAVLRPLRLNLIADVEPPSLEHLTTSTAVLNALARYNQTPLTITADYRTLSALQSSSSRDDVSFRNAYTKLLTSPVHRAVSAPPSNIDFAGLVDNGLGTQVNQQLALSTAILRQVTGRYADSPVVLHGDVTPTELKSLAAVHVGDVVIPESSLTSAPSSTLEWGTPFRISTSPALSVLATDGPLDELVNDRAINAGRRAVLTLNTLAFLHFEAPNAPLSRSVTIEISPARTSAAFIDGLLGAVATNPFVVASSLTPSFNSSLVGADGAPSTRVLATTRVSTWSALNVSSLLNAIGQTNSFNQAIASATIANSLSAAIAQAEITGSPQQRQDAIGAAEAALDNQLQNISVDPSAITLAGSGTSLPVTILSTSKYAVTAVVHLVTDRLHFPKGNSQVVTLDASTKSLQFSASSPRGTDLTLQIVVTTPNDQLVLARTAIQVRIAGNSVVGYLLTLASLLVLAYWWIRTYRRTTKGRHAR